MENPNADLLRTLAQNLEEEAANIRDDTRYCDSDQVYQISHNIRCAEARELRATVMRCTAYLLEELK